MKKYRDTCPICGDTNIVLFDSAYDRHYGYVDKLYDVYQCKKCHLLFLNPMIEDEELFNLYPKDYYNTDIVNIENIKKKIRNNFLKDILLGCRPKDIKQSFIGKTVLDLGVGDCEQLYLLHKNGASAYGTEIRESACLIGAKLGLKISKGTLFDAEYPSVFFDYVRSNHSFEHITEPEKLLIEINRILKYSGELFIGVPNTDSWTFKLFKKYWYYIGVPFHPFSYNPHNLILFVEQYGFKVKKISYNANWCGFMGSIQIMLNTKNNKKSDEGWFWNKFNKVFCHQIARLSNLFKQGDCMEITFIKIK
jgi:SAM-dependent methyltransferase